MSNARIERFLFSGRRGRVRTDPAKADPYKSIFGEYTFIRVRLGVCIHASPRRPAKGVLRELQTRFAGRRDAGSARVALRGPYQKKVRLVQAVGGHRSQRRFAGA